MVCRARIILPQNRVPINNGAVVVDRGRIAAVGLWQDLVAHFQETAVDLGDAILMPGFINAHCHLDYTQMAGKIPPQRAFADWIKSIVAIKSSWSDDDFYRSWLCGAEQSVDSGVTTLVDVEAIPALLTRTWHCTPMRIHSYAEVIGLRDDPPPSQALANLFRAAKMGDFPRDLHGLSPHAPYTTTPALLQECLRIANQHQWRLTMHVAESREEFDMFMFQRGPLHDWLRNQRSMQDCLQGSPVQYLLKHGFLNPGLLAVHLNYLGPGDAHTLAQRQVSVAHCPRSHAYFQHDSFPYQMLTKNGVNICLGTDSLASTASPQKFPVTLDMFDEMRAFQKAHPDVDPATILSMATMNGAQALGLSGKAGALAEGTDADMIAIPYSGPVEKAYEAVLEHRGPVLASMIQGKWALGKNLSQENR